VDQTADECLPDGLGSSFARRNRYTRAFLTDQYRAGAWERMEYPPACSQRCGAQATAADDFLSKDPL